MDSHHDVLSAVYLMAATGLGIRCRIVHVHNADMCVPTGSAAKSALLREPMRQMCLRFAHKIVGVSRYTLANFLKYRPVKRGRDLVVYCAIDTTPFHEAPPDVDSIRRDLGLPGDARILLFASRMVSYKNPMFVLDILSE
jgi:glycosyltransferase involved in cell wall biosynthesis